MTVERFNAAGDASIDEAQSGACEVRPVEPEGLGREKRTCRAVPPAESPCWSRPKLSPPSATDHHQEGRALYLSQVREAITCGTYWVSGADIAKTLIAAHMKEFVPPSRGFQSGRSDSGR